MNSAKLDRVITLYFPTHGKDAAGAPTVTYTAEDDPVFAQKIELKSMERYVAQQVGSEHDVRFRIRWHPTVTDKWQLDYEGTRYGIKGIVEVGRREYMDITARTP